MLVPPSAPLESSSGSAPGRYGGEEGGEGGAGGEGAKGTEGGAEGEGGSSAPTTQSAGALQEPSHVMPATVVTVTALPAPWSQ